jgi:hypothetical protein
MAMTIANAMRTTFPAYPPLLRDVVHVWQVNLDQPDSVLQHLAQTLAVDERAKAERFHRLRLSICPGMGSTSCSLVDCFS